MPTTISMTEVTPAATSSHEDVDVTSLVGADAGNVAAVHLRLHNITAGALSIGIRNNGSTNDIYGPLQAGVWDDFTIGVDSGDIFEARVSNTGMRIYMWGYSTNDEAESLVNHVSFAGDMVEATWSTVTAHLAAFTGTPMAVFGTCLSTGFDYGALGVRPTGSSNNITQVGPRSGDRGWTPFSMTTDSNGQFDFFSANVSQRFFNVNAILTSGVTSSVNGTAFDLHSSANANTWVGSSLTTGPITTGDPMVFAHIYAIGGLSNDIGLRPGGNTDSFHVAEFTGRQHYGFLPMTATDSIEIFAFDGGQGDPRVATTIYGSAGASPGGSSNSAVVAYIPRMFMTMGVGR